MRLRLLALTIIAAAVATPAFAGDVDAKAGHGKAGHGKGTHRRVFCPHCGEACYPTVTKGTETKHCWNIETKTICIPKIRFPWETRCCDKGCGKDGCLPPKCGRTKEVRVLVKHEYECTVCKYSWDPNSFKNGKGDDKYKAGPVVDEGGAPKVADPPPVEARREIRQQQPLPVRFELPEAADESVQAPRRKSYAEILTGFFQ